MGRHQLRLLLCSIAAIGLLIASLFGKSWFTASMGYGPSIGMDLRNVHVCQDGVCAFVSLTKMKGLYPAAAMIAFWASVPVLLLVAINAGLRILSGQASATLTRIGYLLSFVALLAGLAAGFLFGPESQSIGDMAGVVVERTIAPGMFSIGMLLAMIALRYSTLESSLADDATYKPVVVRKDLQSDRLPVTPITGVKKVPAPPSQPLPRPSTPPAGKPALPDSLPFDASYGSAPDLDPGLAGRAKSSTNQPPVASGQPLEISIRTRPPSQPPIDHEDPRAKSPTGPRARAATSPPIAPIEIVHKPDARPRSASQAPLSEDDLVGVDQRARTIDLSPQRARTSSSGPVDVAARLSAAAAEAAAHISVKPPLPVAEPTPPDEIAVAPESGLRIRKRTPTGGNLPLAKEEPSASIAPPEVGLHFHKKAPSLAPPIAEPLPASAFAPPPDAEPRRKSESMAGVPRPTITADGLADVLAQQPTSAPGGARQTLPPPNVPATSTPPMGSRQTLKGVEGVRSPTMPPLESPTIASAKTQTIPPVNVAMPVDSPAITSARTQTIPPATIIGAKAQTVPPPVASDKHKTLPPPTANVLPAPASASGSGSMPAMSRALTPRSQGSGAMPADTTMPGSIAEAARAHADSQPPANATSTRAASTTTPPTGRPSGSYSQQFPRSRPVDAKTDEYRPLEKHEKVETAVELPEHVRGKIHYAVLTAELSGAGIHARREDGMTKLVAWGDIIGIVARRFPPGAPYDGATFVDLVSTAGATLRILPWTQIKGHGFADSIVKRARELVNIVAAQSLDARLDAPTRLFADSEGQAAQLPDATSLAAHDQKLA